MEILDSQANTLPMLPRTERSAHFLEVLSKPITAQGLASLVHSADELDGAFAIIETWCQKNPEKVFPRPSKEAKESWEMLVDALIQKATRTILRASEEQGVETFYEAVGRYTEALSAKILRELSILALRNGFRGIFRRIFAEVLQLREISKGKELALSRSFKIFEGIQTVTTQFLQERTLRSEPCSQALVKFHTDLLNALWKIYDECLRLEKRATPFEKKTFLNRVHQGVSKVSRDHGIPHLPVS